MPVSRLGFRAIAEWALAASGVLLLAGVVSSAVEGWRQVPSLPPVLAEPASGPPPASMFSGAVFVPMLLLSTGDELRVGEHASTVAARLNRAWQIGTDALERTAGGLRTIRRYDDGTTQFAVVLEAADQSEHIVAIYVR